MYIQDGWRSFIPVYSNKKYLKAIRIDCPEEMIEENIELPFYYYIIPKFFKELKNHIYDKSRQKVIDVIERPFF